MKRTRRQAGFTIIELLIACAVGSIILIIAAQGFVGSTQTVVQVSSQSDLLEENRIAGQMIADSVTRAVYVYPPGSKVKIAAASNALVKDPKSGTTTFTVGTSPIVAYLEAPTASSPNITFVAYYAVLRGDVYTYTAPGGVEGVNNPGKDPANDSDWLLYEYRQPLLVPTLNATLNPPDGSTTTTVGNVPGATPVLLTDYVAPDGFSMTDAVCRNQDGFIVDTSGNNIPLDGNNNLAPNAGQVPGCPTTAFTGYLASVNRATLNITTRITRAGRTSSSTLSFAIAPRNLYIKGAN